jgi:type IV pilus assembly protein PilC
MAETALITTPFIWEGTDRKGNKVKGKSMANTEAAVRADLRRQGVVPSRIRKQRQKPFSAGAKVTPADIAVFSRQLATMLAAGIPLVQAFEIVGTGHYNPAMQKLILGVKADVEGGSALAEALAKQPLYFDDLFVNLVEAGEQAGALETLLDKIATYKEKTEALKKVDLSGGGAGRCIRRYDDSPGLRNPGIRGPVPGIRRGPAYVYAYGD